MEKNLQNFLVELIQHYSDQEDIWYICYDGTAEPSTVEYDPHFIMKSKNSLEQTGQWLTEYLAEEENIYYYKLFKALIKETSGLWVNPTLEELRAYNKRKNQDINAFLENYVSPEEEWINHAKKEFSDVLDKNGYSLIQGKSLIERLVQAYDSYNRKDKSFIEWVKPIDISLIDNHADYILDREVFQKPRRLTKNMLNEYINGEFKVLPPALPYYFENVLVTQRGMESQEVLKDKYMDFYFYQEIIDYLDDNPYETMETAYQKLFKHSVNPSLSFVEIIIDNFTELYVNTQQLQTESDILSFINQAYTIEGSDLEAKSFNRKQIICKLSENIIQKRSSRDSLDKDPLNNKWDDRNYSFK